MGNTAVSAQGVSKRYWLGAGSEPFGTLREAVARAVRSPARFLLRADTAGGRDLLWALKDVSFRVDHGEVVGIIGRNGAGKTTLLKILSRITDPTEGRAEIRGRVSSLLEVGTGFHPELTGRENVFLNGAILGMTRTEIVRQFDDIVSFAEVARFIDTPVKRYSTGMRMRLAFAVAAHLQPEILIVDEVLAVGDLAFQRKCLGKMGDVASGGRTVLFVSHNMQAVRSLCPRVLLLDGGRLVEDGPAAAVVSRYTELARQVQITPEIAVGSERHRRGSGAVRFAGVALLDASDTPQDEFSMGESIRIRLDFVVLEDVDELFVVVALKSGWTADVVTSIRHLVSDRKLCRGGSGSVVLELPDPAIRPGRYPLYLWLGDGFAHAYDVVDDLTAPLTIVTEAGFERLGFDPSSHSGLVSVPSRVVRAEVHPSPL